MSNKKPVNNNRPDRGKNRKSGNDPKITPELERAKLARELNITEKTKNYYDEIINNPSMNQVDAYKKTHDVSKHINENSAAVAASRLLKSDKYEIYKASAVGKAKRRIVSLVDSASENIALKASQDILDRNTGKAIQKTEGTQKIVHVSLDLSGVRLGAHYIKPEQIAADSQDATS